MPVAIRPYRLADLDACRDLWEVLTERHRIIYEDPTIGGPDVRLYFDTHLARVGPEHVWVAEEDGMVIGMTGLIAAEGEEEAEVEPVVVAQGHRSRGVGEQLVQAAVAEAKRLGVRFLNIGPVARNSEAIAMFVRQGFGLIGHVQLFMEFRGPTDDAPARGPERSPAEVAALLEQLKHWS
jgi:GNAT superfamily N-acetyltransferase